MSSPLFVGRVDEQRVLGEALITAIAGRSAAALVGGDAGIGKSRLVDEFCRTALSAGAIVATGTCLPIDGARLPYGPILAAFRGLTREHGARMAAADLGPLVEEFISRSPTPDGNDDGSPVVWELAEEFAKTRLFEAVLASLVRLGTELPVVLVFEDLQWADSASTELIGFLIRNLGDSRVLLIATYRSEELTSKHALQPWLTELRRHTRVTHLRLRGLDRPEMAALIGAIRADVPPAGLVDSIWSRSNGNPFFAEELTAAGGDPELPVELTSVILSRVERVSEDCRQLLRMVAAAGDSSHHELLVALDVLDETALEGAVREALDNHILVVNGETDSYRFRHGLFAEVLNAALLPGERRRLHRLIAGALTSDEPAGHLHLGHASVDGRAAAVAPHWWAAGKWAEALEASTKAADAAIALWAYPEALAHLDRALAAADLLPAASALSPARRRRLMALTADVAYFAGAGTRAVDLIRDAIAGAEAGTDPVELAEHYLLLGRNCWGMGDSSEGLDAYGKAAALVSSDAPSPMLARILAEDARGLMLMSRYVEGETRGREALAVADAIGATRERGHILCTLACCRGLLGFFDEGVELARQALRIAEDFVGPDDLNRAYANLGALLMEAGRLDESAALMFQGVAVSEDLWGVKLNGVAVNGVEALIRAGRFDEAEELLTGAGERGVGGCISGPPLARALIAIRRGRLEEATTQLAIADEVTALTSDVQTRGVLHVRRAELALELDRPGEAFDDIEAALALAAGTNDEIYRPEMLLLAVRCLADDAQDARTRARRFEIDKARLLATEFVEQLNRLAADPASRGGACTPRTAAFAATCAAELSRLHGADPDAWSAAAGLWDAAGEPHPAAWCRWREAEAVLDRRGGRDRAQECLGRAWRATVQIGTMPLRSRIERLAQRARIDLPDGDDAAPAARSTVESDLGLTPREVEVLAQLAAGRRDREIADLLYISKKTVSVHVSNILRKLDVANRFQAGRIGQAHGLG